MCFYRATVYECMHSELGKKVTDCKKQQDILAYTEGNVRTCSERQVHSMNRVRKAGTCVKCQRLDDLKSRTRNAFKSLKENLEKRKTFDDGSGDDGSKAHETFEAVETPKISLTNDELDDENISLKVKTLETSKSCHEASETDDQSTNVAKYFDAGGNSGLSSLMNKSEEASRFCKPCD
ncbi:hypothetical protein CORC01_13969 [Colletotrichum orchidophilum]|uniref:Uncharacterized protein n=1 Tax=Colletotrichum orchidophilum TaxID=1209926 RepID=A0A1G4ANR5_9PEZI|nr:uncharacterized protein CORC01_13969 [Colletotrichum orchidophilum]OHE90746.1 hypothetical protein CORC01_13969 [Colletotrichum orchidophilum]